MRGKLAVITGATRGIGLWIAGALGDAGVAVILVGRDEAGLQSAAEGLRKVGIVSHASRFDLLQTSEIATWFEDVCAKFARQTSSSTRQAYRTGGQLLTFQFRTGTTFRLSMRLLSSNSVGPLPRDASAKARVEESST